MQFDVPLYIHDKPIQSKLRQVHTGMEGKLSYKISVKVYWKTLLSEAQNHKCCWCGQKMIESNVIRSNSSTIEHIIPRSKGGENNPDNYAVACHRCNNNRGDSSVEEFLAKIETSKILSDHGMQIAPNKIKKDHFIQACTKISDKLKLVEDLKEKGVSVNITIKLSRIKRKLDAVNASIEVEAGRPNLFEPESRPWRFYNRYATIANNKQIGVVE
jgi:hypothetical protein